MTVTQDKTMTGMTKAQQVRYRNLLKYEGKGGDDVHLNPKHVRCYDDGKSIDRYTVTFPNIRTGSPGRWGYPYLAMNTTPFHPQGFGQHGESKDHAIDRPRYAHLGKQIPFHALPEDCQRLVLQDYAEYWSLPLDRLIADCLRPSK